MADVITSPLPEQHLEKCRNHFTSFHLMTTGCEEDTLIHKLYGSTVDGGRCRIIREAIEGSFSPLKNTQNCRLNQGVGT